jgi:hypothetical protein
LNFNRNSEAFVVLLKGTDYENIEFVEKILIMMKSMTLEEVPILIISEEANDLERKSAEKLKKKIQKQLSNSKLIFEAIDMDSSSKYQNLGKIFEKFVLKLNVD